LNYENDDSSDRRLGSDSKLTFTAPADGQYIVQLGDVRGLHGEKFSYKLTIRPRRPDFKVTFQGANPTVNTGSGKEFHVQVERIDGFEGPISVNIAGLPPGFSTTSPLTIERGQFRAFGVITAKSDAAKPTAENSKTTKITATATINQLEVTHDVNNLGEIKLAEKPKVLVRIVPADADSFPKVETDGKPLVLEIEPGTTAVFKVRAERAGYKGRIPFGNADSGRNLPHGVYVDNIGLNGLMVVEGSNERTFFITASKIVPEQTRLFHLRATVEGNQTTQPVLLRIKRRIGLAQGSE